MSQTVTIKKQRLANRDVLLQAADSLGIAHEQKSRHYYFNGELADNGPFTLLSLKHWPVPVGVDCLGNVRCDGDYLQRRSTCEAFDTLVSRYNCMLAAQEASQAGYMLADTIETETETTLVYEILG